MARKYELKRRAARKEETRRRIVEAALELHSTIGPANTTVSAIAERAGVQRHTFYAHFPDMERLGWACSGLHMERDPLPDPGEWRRIADPRERVGQALADLYAYYDRNESLLANVFRDAPNDPVVRVRLLDPIARMGAELAAGFREHDRKAERLGAAIDVALDFQTWRLLVRTRGLSQKQAVELMARLVTCA
jgi:AcrR family transcriptional regulator